MKDLLTDFVDTPALADKGKRWLACFIDYLLYFVLVMLITYGFGEPVIDEDGDRIRRITGTPGFFLVVLPWFLFLPGIESFNKGQTIGKALLRIRTIQEDGSKLTFGKSLVKHLFDWVDYFPFFGIVGLIVASGNKNKQRVGDLVAKTIVVDAKQPLAD
jgi:uncharacterized RDD family membrane protein YckC